MSGRLFSAALRLSEEGLPSSVRGLRPGHRPLLIPALSVRFTPTSLLSCPGSKPGVPSTAAKCGKALCFIMSFQTTNATLPRSSLPSPGSRKHDRGGFLSHFPVFYKKNETIQWSCVQAVLYRQQRTGPKPNGLSGAGGGVK